MPASYDGRNETVTEKTDLDHTRSVFSFQAEQQDQTVSYAGEHNKTDPHESKWRVGALDCILVESLFDIQSMVEASCSRLSPSPQT